MKEERDKIDLQKLTPFQKDKLVRFYGVMSIDELEVTESGDIIVKKKTGGAASNIVSVYIEDYEGKHHKLDIDEFLSKQKDPSLGFQNVEPERAKEILTQFLKTILFKEKELNEIKTLCLEHIGNSTLEMLLFQQFIIFNSNKLKKVLCGDEINLQYIKATGNPAYSDVDLYNVIKKSDSELIIKGFAFCGYPSKKEIYINLVCGTGGTAKLIDALLKLVTQKKLQNKPKFISLDSIETEQALTFYTKLGFRKPKPDTIKTVKEMISTKAKTFSEYTMLRNNKAGGKLYLFPHNKDGERQLKALKCEWIYSPVVWFDTIKQLKKEKKPKRYILDHIVETMRTTKLEGDGIGDFFKNVGKQISNIGSKAKEVVSNIGSRFKPKLNDFTNQSKKTLSKLGDYKIVDMIIQRKPIMGILDKFLNVLSFGKFQELKQKYGYDKLFHLQLGLVLRKENDVKKAVAEKNETVDITEQPFETEKEVQTLRIGIPRNSDFTLRSLVNETRNREGDNKFFSYDPFTNNCQWFIRYLLTTMGAYDKEAADFLFQDVSGFTKELPRWLPGFARGVTDLGATVSNIRGKGKPKTDGLELHAVIFPKDKFDISEARSKAKEFIDPSKKFVRETKQSYRFRNIPKQKFVKKSFVSKKLDNGITLVLGKPI